MPRSVVLLCSGGLDSAVCAALATQQGYALHALSIDYGQRHRAELRCAKRLAVSMAFASHRILHVDLAQWGGSSLTDQAQAVPDAADLDASVPSTYVPGRNGVFLSLACAYAEAKKMDAVWIGCNQDDASHYPDCAPEYLRAFERTVAMGSACGTAGKAIQVEAPLIAHTKAEIVAMAPSLGLDLKATLSCYQPSLQGVACGVCEACALLRS